MLCLTKGTERQNKKEFMLTKIILIFLILFGFGLIFKYAKCDCENGKLLNEVCEEQGGVSKPSGWGTGCISYCYIIQKGKIVNIESQLCGN